MLYNESNNFSSKTINRLKKSCTKLRQAVVDAGHSLDNYKTDPRNVHEFLLVSSAVDKLVYSYSDLIVLLSKSVMRFNRILYSDEELGFDTEFDSNYLIVNSQSTNSQSTNSQSTNELIKRLGLRQTEYGKYQGVLIHSDEQTSLTEDDITLVVSYEEELLRMLRGESIDHDNKKLLQSK